jgi:LruC domain-containing protein
MKWQYKIAILLKLMCISGAVQATEKQRGQYVWDFLSGQSWPQGYNQNIGKPDNLIWSRGEYSNDFFERINNALPERKLNEAFITDDDGSTIHLDEEAEVFVTFIHEGAGYKNSFGFFTFDRENPPTTPSDVSETIIFPNLSYPHMAKGHRLSLGVFPAGTSIGFFIAANGFNYYSGVKTRKSPYYYSLQDLNPESDPSLRQHAVLLYDEEVKEVILGFEDLNRNWGDNDFNDAVFSIKSTPETAINIDILTLIPNVDDSDADGVSDTQDEFPEDYRRAFSSYFPSDSSYVTLAYEDNWPKLGDYDFNDLVIKERLQITYDASGLVSGFIIHGFISARGASKSNGFALRLVDLPPSEIEGTSLTINGNTYQKNVENDQTDAVITLWGNSKTYTQTGQSGQCSHFNTLKQCGYFEPVPFTFDVRFNNSQSGLNHSDLDFFIYRTYDRTLEVHMPGYAPTDWFNFSRFGTGDDTSNASQGRYFRTKDNLPWAIQISDDWNYPREYIDVLWAYPDYETWVESSGTQNIDWYKTSPRTTHFYSVE